MDLRQAKRLVFHYKIPPISRNVFVLVNMEWNFKHDSYNLDRSTTLEQHHSEFFFLPFTVITSPIGQLET